MKKIFKKGLSVLMSATILMSSGMMATSVSAATGTSVASSSYKFGDIAGPEKLEPDGKVDINDLNGLQDYVFKIKENSNFKLPAGFKKAADINEDGKVDDKDVDAFVDALIYADSHRGNVNKDGGLSVADSSCIQKYLVGTEKFDINSVLAADVNGDGEVKVNDATAIQKQMIGLVKPSSFPTAAIKEADAKYRGTYDSKTGTYKGGEYSDLINYIEKTTNVSFERLLRNNIYIVKTPNSYTSIVGDSVWVRDENWCYEVSPNSGVILLWGCYSNNKTMVVPTSLAGYEIEFVSEFFGERELFPNYPSEKTTIDSIKTLIIPNTDGYMKFRSGCFEGLKGLQNVVFQEGINDSQFSGNIFKSCKNLKNVIWPDSLTRIAGGFFWNCKSITSIQQLHLPTTVNEISENAFCGSGLKEITVPEHVRTIKNSAFENVPARTATFLYKKIADIKIAPSAFRVWGDDDVDKKLQFMGHKNSSYELFAKETIDNYQIMINLGIYNSMDDMPYVFNYFKNKQ